VNLGLYGYLTIVTFAVVLVLGALGFVFINRIGDRASAPISQEIGGIGTVLRKVRKRQPMSDDELDFATQYIAHCRSLIAYSIPGVVFAMGWFYVFGSLEQLHGAAPSVRTFIGVLPMLASINLTAQLLRVARLKGRLQRRSSSSPGHLTTPDASPRSA
jgi:hypothetical protein